MLRCRLGQVVAVRGRAGVAKAAVAPGYEDAPPTSAPLPVPTRPVVCGTALDPTRSPRVLASYPGDVAAIQSVKLLNQQQERASPFELPYYVAKECFPSVSLLLDASASADARGRLERWQTGQIAKLGEAEFKIESKRRMGMGGSLHKAIERCLLSRESGVKFDAAAAEAEMAEEVRGFWRSVQPVLAELDDADMLEKFVTHWRLCYRGKFDAIANYKNQLFLFDFKTMLEGSSKERARTASDLYDDPLQVAAYIGALNADGLYKKMAKRAMVVLCKANGDCATTVSIGTTELHEFWQEFLERVGRFWHRMSAAPAGSPVDFRTPDLH